MQAVGLTHVVVKGKKTPENGDARRVLMDGGAGQESHLAVLVG